MKESGEFSVEATDPSVDTPVDPTGQSVEARAEVSSQPVEEPVEEATQPVDDRKTAAVSSRKINANRQNALKSTGPRTPNGKAHSRANSLKHGLFAMDIFVGEAAKRENRRYYQEILDGLWQHFQPVGLVEQLEVRRIAACWWRLGRAWRFENSNIASGDAAVESRNLVLVNLKGPISDSDLAMDLAILDLLRRVESEIETGGRISDELKRQMVSKGRLQKMWVLAEKAVRGLIDAEQIDFEVSDENRRASDDPNYSKTLLWNQVRYCIFSFEERIKSALKGGAKGAYDNVAVPSAEALDRLLRAEAATERALNRAFERLERLQRRRLGEAVPPPLSVHLTR